MRILITLVFLVALFGTPVHGQQSSEMFQINDPLQGDSQIPVELLYFDEAPEPASAYVAPPLKVVPPSVDERTMAPETSMPMLGTSQAPTQRPTHSPIPNSALTKVSILKNNIEFVRGSVHQDQSLRTTVETFDGVPIKNHFFFGIDRDSCCDEWGGLCGCGGLKANPGQWGQPWIRGMDACEESCCHGKHGHRHKHHRKKCNTCDGSCGSGPCD